MSMPEESATFPVATHERGPKLVVCLCFTPSMKKNQAELKQPERLETRGWLVGGSAGASIAESEDVSVGLAGE